MTDRILPITRRGLAALLAGGALPAGMAVPARAQGRKGVLVIGLDISDTVTLDPAKQNNYSPPLTLMACYDTLVTMQPGKYETLVPSLATSWARTPDGKGWRFTLKPDAKFSSGKPVTAEDWKFTFDRIAAIKDQTSQYAANVIGSAVPAPGQFDLILKEPNEPILSIIAAPGFAVLEKAVVEAQGGSDEKSTTFLNGASAGTGAYVLTAWSRNQQIQMQANPHSWRGPSKFQRIVIRHIGDSAAQLLAIQRGDVDVAFNLIPEQIATLRGDAKVRVEGLTSLDFVYMALTQGPEVNKALAQKEARQAIGYAIDYDGIINNMLGGKAVRPASFLPIGVRGSTEAIAREIGFRQDLDRAKSLLQKAGLADGFEFDISYGNAAIAGISYQSLAQKVQADLARVGIRAKLSPMDQVTMRTQYLGAKSQSALTFWNPPAVENLLWASASVQRVAKRVHWVPDPALIKLVDQAAAEQNAETQAKLWVDYQKAMIDQANYIILFQPVYQVAVSNGIKTFPLTAAGWLAELNAAAPG